MNLVPASLIYHKPELITDCKLKITFKKKIFETLDKQINV